MDATDATIWQACQDHDILLITGNRNAEGPESLGMTIRQWNAAHCLPVLTLADPDRIQRERPYAEAVVERLFDILIDPDALRGPMHRHPCKRHFLETHGTPLHGKQVEPDKLVWAIAALAEGIGSRAVARVFESDPKTILGWLVEAAEHLELFTRYHVRALHVEQVQMDELFALLSAVKEGKGTEAEAIKRLSRSPHWVWIAMDPVCKLILAVEVGDRTLAMAQRLVHQVMQMLAPECAPLFLTDGLREYVLALVTHYGRWMQPERRQAKGPTPKSRWMPQPRLLYAQVVKSYRPRRIVGVKHCGIFGAAETIESILAKRGWTINTSFVERSNLDLRQHVAAIGRRVNTLCQHEAGLRQQLALFHTYHNFVLPHTSWRVPLSECEMISETGSIKRWRQQTPAMARAQLWKICLAMVSATSPAMVDAPAVPLAPPPVSYPTP